MKPTDGATRMGIEWDMICLIKHQKWTVKQVTCFFSKDVDMMGI